MVRIMLLYDVHVVNGKWVWSVDICEKCYEQDKVDVMLTYDDETRTARCRRCGHTESYSEDTYNLLMVLHEFFYKRTPGTYYFKNLEPEQITRNYLRELEYKWWDLWTIHDYILAKIQGDENTKNRIIEAVKLLCERMDYDPEPWMADLEEIDEKKTWRGKDYLFIPSAIQWWALHEDMSRIGCEKELKMGVLWNPGLYQLYLFKRVQGDLMACWMIFGIASTWEKEMGWDNFYDVDWDPYPLLFHKRLEGKWKGKIDPVETAIRWKLDWTEHLLNVRRKEPNSFGIAPEIMKALAIKIAGKLPGARRLYVARALERNDAKKIAEAVGDMELMELYDLAQNTPIGRSEGLDAAEKLLAKVKNIVFDPSLKLKKSVC